MGSEQANRSIISIEERLTSAEAYALRTRMTEIGGRSQHFSVSFDGAWLLHADFGTGRNLVRVVCSGGPPSSPITAQIIGRSPSAVARLIARIWPKNLTVEDFNEPRRRNDDTWFKPQ